MYNINIKKSMSSKHSIKSLQSNKWKNSKVLTLINAKTVEN
jgi:hypothetical protein